MSLITGILAINQPIGIPKNPNAAVDPVGNEIPFSPYTS